MKPLVVLGDTLLDVDVHGTSNRLSPEAPIPVVDLAEEHARPGGAGLAALLAARATSGVVLITALGSDPAGRRLRALLEPQLTVVALELVGDTVRKQRVWVGPRSLLRLDSGDGRAADHPVPEPVLNALRSAGAVLVSDYGHGVAAHPQLRRVLGRLARRVPVVWDPHPKGAAPVPGAALVTPNEIEARTLLAASSRDNGADPGEVGERLRRRWGAEAVAVTLGSRGAVLRCASGETVRVAVPEADGDGTVDTCGAGDRFAAAAAIALREGAGCAEAVRDAVAAATAFVRSGGVGALTTIDAPRASASGSLCEVGGAGASAFAVAERVRRTGGRLVATGGCFDLLHPGHASLLRQARALGDALVVCLNSDASVRRLKGPGRPLLSAPDRARMLTELSSVDAVVIFEEATPAAVLDRLRPDVWVKGGDYTGAALPETEVVTRHGGEVVLLPTVPGYSTTGLVRAAGFGVRRLEHTSKRSGGTSS